MLLAPLPMSRTPPDARLRSDLPAQDIVAKLWHLCNILRDAGITYPEYVTELTYLLFLRMAEETGAEKDLPRGFRWHDLTASSPTQQFGFYKRLLRHLGGTTTGRVREIFTDAETALTSRDHLALLVKEFDRIDWYKSREESALADIYEGLLEKNATESKAGAGQYFTPRALIESMVAVSRPAAGEIVQDPACGTGGFLIAADRYIRNTTDGLKQLSPAQIQFQRRRAFVGVELVTKTHRLALMNAMLHGIHSPIILGDALGNVGANLAPADLILTNPPFGTKRGGGVPSRMDLQWRVSNKQLCFLQHVYRGLRSGGRAAIIMPELQGATAARVCDDLMDTCHLHTILRLPTGIFYAPSIKANVLFFRRGSSKRSNTKSVWIYDLRSKMPAFGRRNPFMRSYLEPFEHSYGAHPAGTDERSVTPRFRCFTREEIRGRGNSFDFSWPVDDGAVLKPDLREPEQLLDAIARRLRLALGEMESLADKLKD